MWSGHSCPLPLPLTLMSSPRCVPHPCPERSRRVSRVLCARKPALSELEGWGFCVKPFRARHHPEHPRFHQRAEGSRVHLLHASLRISPPSSPKLAFPKLSVKVGCHNFEI